MHILTVSHSYATIYNILSCLQELFSWDKGNQLTYPVRCHAIEYGSPKENKNESETTATIHTGVEIIYSKNSST